MIMKLSKKLKFSLFFVCIILLLFVSTISYADNSIVQPRTLETNESVAPINEGDSVSTEGTTSNTDNHEKDLYLFNNSVNVDYPVSGNVFIFANDATINSKILGNAFVFAKNVNIDSKTYINASLFVCAENVTVDGVVFDLYSASDKLTVSSTGRILRDISACGQSLDLYGSISRNANLTFENINLSDSTSSIGGDLSYSSKVASIPEELVKGEFSFHELISSEDEVTNNVMDYLSDLLKTLVVSAIIILIIIFATPKFAEKEQKILENKFGACIGYGAIALIAIPVACFILFCTVLGIIPALSILFAYIFLIAVMALALVAIPLAKIICNKLNKNSKGMNVLASIIIVALLWLLEQIPVIGGIVSLLVAILGLGILAYSIFHSNIDVNDKNVVAQANTVVDSKKEK